MTDDSSRQWAYTDLSEDRTIVLEIDSVEYDLVQFTGSYGLNEMPTATCLLAIGRDARDKNRIAPIHAMADNLSQMRKAKVTLKPRKDWKPKQGNDSSWSGEEVIFEGYYVGMAYRKLNDRIQAIVHLTHWLLDLGFSSTLDSEQHPSNSASLVVSSIAPQRQTGVSGQPIFISQLVDHEVLKATVHQDIWEGIKTLLCGLAKQSKLEFKCKDANLGSGNPTKNDMALAALSKIQGPGGTCGLAYDFDMGGMPLEFIDNGIEQIKDSVATSILDITQRDFASYTFWDAIIGLYCPMFNMALVPQVTTATIIASTPALNLHYSKVILPGEYDNIALTGAISRPLYGVAVLDAHIMTTGPETGSNMLDMCSGGAFTSPAESDGDGMWLVIESPPWLKNLGYISGYVERTSGIPQREASNTSTNPGAVVSGTPLPSPSTLQSGAAELYTAYAKSVYVANMLRGRGATLSGKLRFDIAPGSIVKIAGDSRKFAGAEDNLETDLYGHVVRVTVSLNAESRQAGTTFQFSHIRTTKEFLTDERTRVTEHPLFGPKVYRGAPLIKNWKF